MKLIDNVSMDFVKGATTALIAVAVKMLIDLIRAPSVKSIEELASKPVKHKGDDSKITVFGFSGCHQKGDLLDASPFVSRVEIYLRLIEVPYEKKLGDLNDNPRHKIPYANVYGRMLDDSERIINYIKTKTGKDLDAGLSKDQLAQGHLIRTMLRGSLYFCMVYQRFATMEGRQLFTQFMTNVIPFPIRPIIMGIIFRRSHNDLYGMGLSRYPKEDIIKTAQADLASLSQILGSKNYILGTEKPTSFDVDCMALLLACLDRDGDFREERFFMVEQYCNLIYYVDRMKSVVFRDNKKNL